MSRPIAVGDLVQVVYPSPCCGSLKGMGITFKFAGFGVRQWCRFCGKGDFEAALGYSNGGVKFVRLKRIPPLSELEGERTEESLKETA